MLARWQATITDESGNIVPGASVEVRREIPGAPLASLYSDRDGTILIGNPVAADDEGFISFHVIGGSYKIRAYLGAFERIWRYVGIGTNSEQDFGTVFSSKGAWSAVVTYAKGDVVSSVSGGDPYAFVSNEDANLNHAPPFTGSVGTSDTHWTVLGLIEAPGSPGTPGSSDVVGTSLSNVAIGTGTKIFTVVEADRGWGVGARVRVSSDANPTANYMEGVITDYSDPTLEVSVDIPGGSGSHSDWTINIAGERGLTGGGLSNYDTSTGTDTIVATVNNTKTLHLFQALNANTGAATFNGLPLKDKDGNALVGGEIQPGVYYLLSSDGVNYYIIMSGAVT